MGFKYSFMKMQDLRIMCTLAGISPSERACSVCTLSEKDGVGVYIIHNHINGI